MRQSARQLIVFIPLLLWYFVLQVEAQSMRNQLEETEIYLSERTRYQVTISGVEEVELPDISVLQENFEISGPSTSQNTNIIMGRVSRQISFIYELTPRKAGTIPVPSPTVKIKGASLKGNDLSLNVLSPEKQDIARLELMVAPQKVYPTQPFTVTLRILLKPIPTIEDRVPITLMRSPELDLGWLRNPPEGLTLESDVNKILGAMLTGQKHGFALIGFERSSQRSPFDFFAQKEQALIMPKHKRERLSGMDGQTHEYFVFEIPIQYSSEKSGLYTFGSTVMKGSFTTQVVSGRLESRKLLVIAEPVSVEISDLHTLNAPANFCGAIGRITATATATPQKLRVGDPMSVELSVIVESGGGSLNLIGAPNLRQQEDLVQNFVVIDERPTGTVAGNAKKFVYAMRPTRTGNALPPIKLSYFDTAQEKFIEIATAPIPLEIVEPEIVGAAEVVSASGSGSKESNTLKRLEGGIHANLTQTELLGNQFTNYRIHLALPPFLLCTYLLLHALVQRHRRLASDIVWQRRQQALSKARTAMQTANSGHLRSILLTFIADNRNLPAAGMTVKDGKSALYQANCSLESVQSFEAFMNEIENLTYGAAASETDIDTLRARALNLIERLQEELKR